MHDEYHLASMQAHWGSSPQNGSAHLINSLGYAAEIHLIHWNSKYESIEKAINCPDGLLVLAVFVEAWIILEIFYTWCAIQMLGKPS